MNAMTSVQPKDALKDSFCSQNQNEGCPPAFRSSDQSALKKLLECPFCKEVAKPPIYTCKDNVHMICEDCSKIASECPLCKTPISEAKCTFMESCMERVFLQCKFKEHGCQLSLNAKDYRNHLAVCPFRDIQCFMPDCGKMIPFKEFFMHLQIDHRDKVNGIENGTQHVVEWWIEGDSSDIARWPPYYFTCYNNAFLYTAISTVHGMWEWCAIIADEEEAARFQVISTIRSPDKKTELKWKGGIHSVRKSISDITNNGLCFVTNSKDTRNPYLYQKKDSIRYFWRTNVEIIQLTPPPLGSIPYLLTTEKGKEEPPPPPPTPPPPPPKLISTGTSTYHVPEETPSMERRKTAGPITVNETIRLRIMSENLIDTSEFEKRVDNIRRKSRKSRNVSIMEEEGLTEVVADADIRTSLPNSDSSETFQVVPEPPKKMTYFKVSNLDDDRYSPHDDTN